MPGKIKPISASNPPESRGKRLPPTSTPITNKDTHGIAGKDEHTIESDQQVVYGGMEKVGSTSVPSSGKKSSTTKPTGNKASK